MAADHHARRGAQGSGTSGVDIPSMAREVVRQVRRRSAIERLQETAATLTEPPDETTPARRETSREDGARVESKCGCPRMRSSPIPIHLRGIRRAAGSR